MKTMALPTIIIGLLLVAVGYWGYEQPVRLKPTNDTTVAVLPGDELKTEQPKSKTALIPAFFGLGLIVLGALSTVDGLRKHVMHLAAMVGLLGAVGGLYPIVKQAKTDDGIDFGSPSAISSLAMVGLCALFVFLCVKSFINVRKAREAAALKN